MEIPLKISVQCTDGLAGQVKCVMVNPVSQQLTHMVVEERGFPHLKRLVPLELIKNGNSGHIQLSCTTPQLATLRPFLEMEYPRNGALYFSFEADKFHSWPYESSIQMPVPPQLEQISPEELAIHQDSPVETLNGRIGKVKAFLVNPTNKELTAIAIQAGYFWQKQDVTLPISQVDHFEKDLVFLKLDKQHLKRLAAIQAQRSYV